MNAKQKPVLQAKSPWIERFDGITSRDAIKSRAAIEPERAVDLAKSPPKHAEIRLRTALKGFYLPSTAELDLS